MPRATPIPIPALAPDESPFKCSLDVWVAKLELAVVLVSLNEEELVVVEIVVKIPVITKLPTGEVSVVSPSEELAVLEVVVADTLAMEAEYEEQRSRPMSSAATISDAWQAATMQGPRYPPIMATLVHWHPSSVRAHPADEIADSKQGAWYQR
jgi:hypothetical protein